MQNNFLLFLNFLFFGIVHSSFAQNVAPVIPDLKDLTLNEDGSASVFIIATDANNDSLIYSATSDTNKIYAVFTETSNLTISPKSNWYGTDNISVIVSDGILQDTASFKVAVLPVNDPPVLSIIPSDTTFEDVALTVPVIASDVDDSVLTYSFLADTALLDLVFKKDSLTLTPRSNYFGTTLVSVMVKDTIATDTITFSLVVLPVNDTPIIKSMKDLSMIEDSTVARVALSAIDIDKDTLSFVALYDTLAFDMQIDGDTLEIISLPNYFGSSSMSVVVSDGVSSDTTAFKIDVAPRQDPPSAFNWIGSLTDTIRVDIQNQFAEPLVLRWSESYDTLDGIYATDVSYIISMQTGTQDDLQYYKTDSLQFGLFYSTLISDIFDSHPLATSASISFGIKATDGLDTVRIEGEEKVIFVDRYNYLSVDEQLLPDKFALHENYPNPFNPSTTIRYDLPIASDVRIMIYNMLGQQISTYDLPATPAGYHRFTWNAINKKGEAAAAGVYFYQIHTRKFTQTRKMILLK